MAPSVSYVVDVVVVMRSGNAQNRNGVLAVCESASAQMVLRTSQKQSYVHAGEYD